MHEVTSENYYTEPYYMSVSSFKKFENCEVDGLLPFNTTSIAMMVGSYVDSYIENTLEQFLSEHPYLKPKDAPDGYINIYTASGELSADFLKAQKICKFIEQDKIIKQFLSGEKQTIMTGNIAGVPFKIKMDSYSPSVAIVDLKVMATITNRNGDYYDFITTWGYDIQLACYQEIVYQNTGEKLPCFIAVVTKETPINSAVVNIPQYVMDRALYRVTENIQRFYDIKMEKLEPVGCGKCKSCISSRKETPLISMEDFLDFIG